MLKHLDIIGQKRKKLFSEIWLTNYILFRCLKEQNIVSKIKPNLKWLKQKKKIKYFMAN